MCCYEKKSIAWVIYKDMERHKFASLVVRRPRSSYWKILDIVYFSSFQKTSTGSSHPVPSFIEAGSVLFLLLQRYFFSYLHQDLCHKNDLAGLFYINVTFFKRY